MQLKVTILQIRQVDIEALQFIREELKKIFPKTEVSILETIMPIPKESYDLFRRQYNSTHILTEAGRFVTEVETDYVIGVTDVDLYVPNLNFVFGEAECPGKIALMSLF
jgi:archaemetzincin